MVENNNKKVGVVYILINPSFPDYIKIGYTNNLEKRLDQLNRSECIPFAFKQYATIDSPITLGDKVIHKIIDLINPDLRAIDTFKGKKRKKEFFALDKDKGVDVLKAIAALAWGDPSAHVHIFKENELCSSFKKDESLAKEISQDSEKEKNYESHKKRKAFKFNKFGIGVGEQLICTIKPNMLFKTYDENNQIVCLENGSEYYGKHYAASRWCKIFLNPNQEYQGTIYFKYKGKLLAELSETIHK